MVCYCEESRRDGILGTPHMSRRFVKQRSETSLGLVIPYQANLFTNIPVCLVRPFLVVSRDTELRGQSTPLLVLFLLRQKKVPHGCPCIPATTQLRPLEHLLLFSSGFRGRSGGSSPLVPPLRHGIHKFTSELLGNPLVCGLVGARLPSTLWLRRHIVNIHCVQVSAKFRPMKSTNRAGTYVCSLA